MTHTPSTPLNEGALEAATKQLNKEIYIGDDIAPYIRSAIQAYLAALPTTPDHKSSLVEALEAERTKACNWDFNYGHAFDRCLEIVHQHESSLSAAAKVEAPPRVDDEMVQIIRDFINVLTTETGDIVTMINSLPIDRAKAAIAALTTPDHPINSQPKGE